VALAQVRESTKSDKMIEVEVGAGASAAPRRVREFASVASPSRSMAIARSPVARRLQRDASTLGLLALVVLAVGLGLREPWPADEPRFALAAVQMVQSGDWLFPHRGGELYADKPPLFMWLQALSFEVTRSWRIAFLRGLDPGSDAAWRMLAVCGAIGLVLVLLARPRHGVLGFFGASLPVWLLVFGLWGYPLLDGANSSSALMHKAGAMIGSQAELGMVGWKEQNLLQAERPVTEWGFRQPWHVQRAAAREWLAEAPSRRFVLVRGEALGPCVSAARIVRVGTSNRLEWWLVSHGSWLPDCVDRAPGGEGDERS
jgi:hypothetical protein